MKTLLYQYNPWWDEGYRNKDFIDRPSYTERLKENIKKKHIVFLTGLRRVGKTTLMKIIIAELLKEGIDKKNILYVSLDDYLLLQKNIFEILEEYRKIHKLRSEEKIFLFLDEITYQNDYHRQLKNLYDKENIKIYATSSSSSLLKDKKAFLTGRSKTIEIKPLSFEEYKIFKKIEIKKRDSILNESYFEDYIREGGLPELKISPDTARRYLHYFKETYLVYLLPRWGKTNEKLLSPKKIYACDLGIKYLFMGGRDYGSYFENYLYLSLRSNNRSVYYIYEDGIEIDFYTSDGTLIESKYNSELTEKQQKLFGEFQAERKMVIDSVDKLELLKEI